MSIRSNMLLATVALRQRWLDERLRAVEHKLKITAPPAPVPEMDVAEGGMTQELAWILREHPSALADVRERVG